MATADEIERRVEQADTARHAKRSVAAQQVGALAQRRAAIAKQLADIEDQLGNVLAAVSDVMNLDEMATFTDVPAADLTRWLTARKPTRTKRKRPAAGAQSDTHRPSAARTSTARPTSTLPEPAPTRADIADAPVRVPAEVA